MSHPNSLFRLLIVTFSGMLVAFGIPLSGQEVQPQKEASASKQPPALNVVLRHNIDDWIAQGRGIPDDWSHDYLVFSNPGTEDEAIANGTYQSWLNIANDPRYLLQQMKRSQSKEQTSAQDDKTSFSAVAAIAGRQKKVPAPHRDWAFSLGTGTVAQNMYPAKYSFNINATPSCASDFVAYGLNVQGTTGGQANLIALNNLYTSTAGTGFCSGTAPTVYWAYNVSFTTAGKVTTSPVLSLDGSKIIFVESGGSTGPYLHVLVWNSGDGGAVSSSNAPTNKLAAGTGVSGCPVSASCLVSILLNTTTETITNSAPYYDYNNDIVYVGDDNGTLYKVTPVLGSGTPTVTKLTLASGTRLTGAILDNSSGYIFAGSTNGALYAVAASTFALAGSLQVGKSSCGSSNNVLVDPPIVDNTNGWVYEYVTDNSAEDTVVEQASTAGPFTTSSAITVGQGDNGCNSSAQFPTHAPAFDNTYYNGTVTNGHIWVCGRNGNSSSAELWEIPTSGTKGSISGVTPTENVSQIDNTVSHAQCSPFQEIYNGSTDYLFFGEGLSGSFGRLYGLTISGTSATEITGSPITYPSATGGTSAIVIDNVSPDAQASSIYFTTLAVSSTTCGSTSAYCAIKLTQSGLD